MHELICMCYHLYEFDPFTLYRLQRQKSQMGRDAGWDLLEYRGMCGFFLKTLRPLLVSPCRSAHTHGIVLTGMRFSNSLPTSRVCTLVSLFKPQHLDYRDALGKLWTAEAKTLFQKAI